MSSRRHPAELIPAILLGSLLAGCGTPVKTSPMLEIVAGYSQQGQQSFRDRDYNGALASFGKALQIDRSIENADGIALNLLNIAQTYQALNQPEAAHTSLDEILGNALGLFQDDQLAQAATYKSILHLRQAQTGPASEWIEKADAFCGDSCASRGLILNIQARLALGKGQPDAAIDLANRALSIHRKAGVVPEIANSLRLIGEGHLARQLSDKAIPFFQEALQLDKGQGLPAKISTDLLLLGMAYKDTPGQSAVFFRRALAVSLAAGDSAGAQRAGNALASISCRAGGQTQSCN